MARLAKYEVIISDLNNKLFKANVIANSQVHATQQVVDDWRERGREYKWCQAQQVTYKFSEKQGGQVEWRSVI